MHTKVTKSYDCCLSHVSKWAWSVRPYVSYRFYPAVAIAAYTLFHANVLVSVILRHIRLKPSLYHMGPRSQRILQGLASAGQIAIHRLSSEFSNSVKSDIEYKRDRHLRVANTEAKEYWNRHGTALRADTLSQNGYGFLDILFFFCSTTP